MSILSDNIEKFIMDMFETEKEVSLQRNELAQTFRCAPSQINYVLTTRFSLEKGFIISSRRGGGGCIKIIKVQIASSELMDVCLSYLDEPISGNTAVSIIKRLAYSGVIDNKEEDIISAAVSDKALLLPQPLRDRIRASVLKSMILKLMTY